MRIPDEILPFLRGEKFSRGLAVPISTPGAEGRQTGRLELLGAMALGKKVIHLGCCDHKPLIEDKRRRGEWLHDILSASASVCAGIDINAEAVEFVRSLGVGNCFEADIRNGVPAEVADQAPWDMVVAGEMIEHVGDPASFLKSLADNFAGIAGELVLTAPNAFSINNFAGCVTGVELVNTDHRFWFTPYTLAKLAADAGMTPVEFAFADPETHGILELEKIFGPGDTEAFRQFFIQISPFYGKVVLRALLPGR